MAPMVDEWYCNGPGDCKVASHVHINTAPQNTFRERIDHRVIGCNCCRKIVPAGTTFVEGDFTHLKLFFCSMSCFEKGPDW